MTTNQSPSVVTINRVGFIGGVERVILNTGAAARRRGIAFTLACPPGDLALEAARQGLDVAVIGIDRSKRTLSPAGLARVGMAMARGRRQVARVAQSRAASVLHAHHPVGALYAAQAARRLRLPLILHVHETLPVNPLYAFALRRAMPHCARFVCVSDASAALMQRMGAPPASLQRLYNGVDPSFLEPARPVAELAGPGPHIGLFGVLEPRKGQEDFVRAAALLARDHPTAQFWIIGKLSFAENQGYVEGLRRAAAEAGLTERVHLPGHRADVRDWMGGMDAIVLASREKESLPTVLIEGGTLGRPLVATDVGGVREIIQDGRNGLVVPPCRPDLLAAAIGHVLGPAGAALGAQARTDAAGRFAPARFGDEMAALYRSLSADH